jgi:hypothetical protein
MFPPREFAVRVVRRLQEAGHKALWAGGCVGWAPELNLPDHGELMSKHSWLSGKFTAKW